MRDAFSDPRAGDLFSFIADGVKCLILIHMVENGVVFYGPCTEDYCIMPGGWRTTLELFSKLMRDACAFWENPEEPNAAAAQPPGPVKFETGG